MSSYVPANIVVRLFLAGVGVLLLAMFSVFGLFVYAEAKARNELIYQQCVQGELRDTVIVQQLEAAKARVRASLPAGDPFRHAQLNVLSDGILALEPPHEEECFTPNTWWPW